MNLLKIELSQNRVYGLDILRALAILFVVFEHGTYIFSDCTTKRIMELLVFDGVSIFFVLSGFLIGGILIRTIETKEISVSVLLQFWKRRWFRTLPNYFLILVVTFAVLGSGDVSGFAKYFLFIQNFGTPHPPFFGEAWSLSIEEWFYLLIPIGIFIAIKSGIKLKHSLLFVITAIIVTAVCIRYYKFYTIHIDTVDVWDVNFRKQVITRLDTVMFGFLGAYLNYYFSEIWLRHKKWLLFLGVFLLLFHKLTFLMRGQLNLELNIYYCVYSFSVSSLGALLLLPFLGTYKEGQRGIVYKTISVISVISYSMYLINFSVVQVYLIPLLMRLVPISTKMLIEISAYVIYWAITIVSSILIYKYYEAPITKLRDASFFKIIFGKFTRTAKRAVPS